MHTDSHPTAAENYANAAPVPSFQAIQRTCPQAELRAYIQYHSEGLVRALESGVAGDIKHSADRLADLVLRARAAA